MNTDELVERLRNYGDLTDSEVHSTRIEAADAIEALTAQLAEARESERAAMTEVNGLKDALAQTAASTDRPVLGIAAEIAAILYEEISLAAPDDLEFLRSQVLDIAHRIAALPYLQNAQTG